MKTAATANTPTNILLMQRMARTGATANRIHFQSSKGTKESQQKEAPLRFSKASDSQTNSIKNITFQNIKPRVSNGNG